MKAVEDTMGIGGKVVEHMKQLQSDNEKLKEVINRLQFDVGRKLFLEVVVTDKQMSGLLYDWLYSVDENKENMQYFGCNLQAIHFGSPKDHFKEKLMEFLEKM